MAGSEVEEEEEEGEGEEGDGSHPRSSDTTTAIFFVLMFL